jgi:hypothetical protein
MQSIPILEFPSLTYLVLALATALIESKPEFSAKAKGICSSASAKALTAYCSTVEILVLSSYKNKAQAISQDPPP